MVLSLYCVWLGSQAVISHGMLSFLNFAATAAGIKQQQLETNLQNSIEEAFIDEAQKEELLRPLTEQLGSERILRTSTLVPVPPICCTED